jgi:hypothetical protein
VLRTGVLTGAALRAGVEGLGAALDGVFEAGVGFLAAILYLLNKNTFLTGLSIYQIAGVGSSYQALEFIQFNTS